MTTVIKLISKSGDSYELPYDAACLSQVVKDAQPEEDGEVDDVEISKVESACLAKVVEFLKHYHEDPMTEIKTPLEDNNFEGVVKQEWYRNFVTGIDRSLLFELLMAANFMSVQPLLDLACLKVSDELMGKSPEEIRVMLNIPKMTAEEEATARREYRWIFSDESPTAPPPAAAPAPAPEG
ncbi:hypothetical protein ACHAWU_008174 [Discostella pseudostelligera]|uniref:SKP1-like protein n=1 Tax=Discostella pseudostelligera TaxID=259834 RepID=A0ABD3MKF9_9STRA